MHSKHKEFSYVQERKYIDQELVFQVSDHFLEQISHYPLLLTLKELYCHEVCQKVI